ncbi:hypothetical protein HRbin02_00348 [Candidatus Calditenuaceae archaeon HR02]|nr:hypothetical protein HRbin02_00348 [Candidatus Calditenuaceae archaeon HR02]
MKPWPHQLEMEDPADYLASRYKYIFRVPGSRHPIILTVATAGVLGGVTGYLSGKSLQSMLYSVAGFAALPLLLAAISVNIFHGLPLHSTFRRLCQLTLFSNYFITGAALLGYLSTAMGLNITIPLLTASLALTTFIRLTITWIIDGDRGLPIAAWALVETVLASLFITLALEAPLPGTILASTPLGTIIAASTLFFLGLPDGDGISSIRLSRGLAGLMLEGNPRILEEELYRLGKVGERVTEAFVFRGKRTGRLSALVILGFHMGPFRRMGSSMLNWLIESKAAKRGVIAITVKGCTTHKSDIITSRDAERVAEEVVSGICGVKDGWSDEAALWKWVRTGRAGGFLIELAGRRAAVISRHPEPMEDIPEEIAIFADEFNISVIDPHNSFSHRFKRLSLADLADIQDLIKRFNETGETTRGRLQLSICRAGFGGHDPRRGIGLCGYSFVAFEVDGHRAALGVIDGNNAMPWVTDTLRQRLMDMGWQTSEILTTDTHSVNGVVLGGRGYYPIGENTSREEIVSIFERLSSEASASTEEVEAAYVRIKHEGVRLFTEELFEKLATRVKRHAMIYLSGLFGSAITGFVIAILM